jgi:hypothetical protein
MLFLPVPLPLYCSDAIVTAWVKGGCARLLTGDDAVGEKGWG